MELYAFPAFLSPETALVLKYLEMLNDYCNLHPTLDTLSLSGNNMPQRSLQPDSVHFPVLETMKINLSSPADFFKAIITLNLKSLYFRTPDSKNSLSTMFIGLQGKFGGVKQVSFMITSGGWIFWTLALLAEHFYTYAN